MLLMQDRRVGSVSPHAEKRGEVCMPKPSRLAPDGLSPLTHCTDYAQERADLDVARQAAELEKIKLDHPQKI